MARITAPYPHFRRIVRALRMRLGWTQEELAEHAGADYKHLQLLELGITGFPSLDLIERLAKALGTRPWILLCDERPEVLRRTGLTAKELRQGGRRKPGRPPRVQP